jgi:hypothetical protein
MSREPISRAYLQELPELTKRKKLDRLADEWCDIVMDTAKQGKVYYMCEATEIDRYLQSFPQQIRSYTFGGNVLQQKPVFTNTDLVNAFKRKFPDCDVSYEETWVDVDSTNRVLKKGFLIDWS